MPQREGSKVTDGAWFRRIFHFLWQAQDCAQVVGGQLEPWQKGRAVGDVQAAVRGLRCAVPGAALPLL